MEIVGELKEQIKGQLQSLTVVITSVLAIYLALVFQFNNAIKPLIVFAAIPFGAVGVLGGDWLMNMPIGFMVILRHHKSHRDHRESRDRGVRLYRGSAPT